MSDSKKAVKYVFSNFSKTFLPIPKLYMVYRHFILFCFENKDSKKLSCHASYILLYIAEREIGVSGRPLASGMKLLFCWVIVRIMLKIDSESQVDLKWFMERM